MNYLHELYNNFITFGGQVIFQVTLLGGCSVFSVLILIKIRKLKNEHVMEPELSVKVTQYVVGSFLNC